MSYAIHDVQRRIRVGEGSLQRGLEVCQLQPGPACSCAISTHRSAAQRDRGRADCCQPCLAGSLCQGAHSCSRLDTARLGSRACKPGVARQVSACWVDDSDARCGPYVSPDLRHVSLGTARELPGAALAKALTVPLMYSSSFILVTGRPASFACARGSVSLQPDTAALSILTCTDPRTSRDSGSRKVKVAEPSLAINALPFVVSPQPSLKPTGAKVPALKLARG